VTALGKLLRTTVFKLSLAYLVIFGIGCGLLLGRVGLTARLFIDEQTAETIDAEINGLSEAYERGGIRRLVDAVERRSRQPGSSLYLVTTFAGESIVGNVAEISSGVLETPGGSEIAYKRVGDEGVAHPAIARVFVLPGGFRLLVGRDLADREALRGVLLRTLLTSLVWLTVIGVFGGAFVAARVLKRVDAMNESARGIMLGETARRLPMAGTGDELDRLAHNLNDMLDRIAQLMIGLREVSDNIAHDLKTPLTRLRNRAEAALRADQGDEDRKTALESIIGESDALIRTFDSLLMIARLEAGSQTESMTDFDLGLAARDIVELYEPSAEDNDMTLAYSGDPGLLIHADRDLVSRALSNLIDNALKYGRPNTLDSGARIDVATRRVGENIEIEVADHGVGIADDADRARVLDRFVRLETSRSAPGSGLGLSLVNAIARLHKGSLRLENARPGLRAILSLPASNTATATATDSA
jgi:signal transduction histidine kinase